MHPSAEDNTRIEAVELLDGGIRVYEFGARLDKEAARHADEQIAQARRLYNAIVAAMRSTHAEMTAWVVEQAGPEACATQARLDALNEAFSAAKAANDEGRMSAVATERRQLWPVLAASLAATRKSHAATLRERFYSRIGNKVGCVTYELRGAAVADGLGWATANDVLDRALVAWKASMKRGQPPRFAVGEERMQDTLTLQFTSAGGVQADRLLDGSHPELKLQCEHAAGRRKYGVFSFRLGAAAAGCYATGTWQFHRAVPEGAAAMSARLVRRRHANKNRWAIQLVLRLKEPVRRLAEPTGTLAAIHFGWSQDVEGRRVAGVADAADPGLARLIRLPRDVEDDLRRASEIQGERDAARDVNVAALKSIELQGLSEATTAELQALRRLPAQHIAGKRFYRVQRLLRDDGVRLDWLDEWVAMDRKRWQAAVGLARRARGRRRDAYRVEALRLARAYSAVMLEPLDLAGAAEKIDKASGTRTEFLPAARAGRVVAAVFELEQEIRRACLDHGVAVFELSGVTTIRECAHCGGANVATAPDDARDVVCSDCGARTDRKLAGAARAWQVGAVGIEDRIVDFHRARSDKTAEARRVADERLAKMSAARKAARSVRTASVAADSVGSRSRDQADC